MKSKLALLVVVVFFTFAISIVAASPHFIGAPKLSIAGSSVAVCWKEAGLGDNQNVSYTLTADATATYVCVNGGGNCPNAANKITVNGPVSTSGTFASGKNGSISACLTLEPIDAGAFECPGGQTLTLSSVSFSNVRLTDTTNSIVAPSSPSSVSLTFFTCP